MILKDLPIPAMSEHFSTSGLTLDTGSFRTNLRTEVPELVGQIAELYGGFPVETEESVCDFFVRISPTSVFRSFVRPKVRAFIEEEDPFEPMGRDLAFPLFESTLNWCIATRASRFLLVHAAAVARDGRAVILPAPSGSGKSTLSAFLSLNGWRLLSDEFGILRIDDGRIQGNPRPISLKNESIEPIGEAGGGQRMSRSFEGTIKGTIAFLRPDKTTLNELREPCTPALVVFPSFQRQAAFSMRKLDKAEGFMRIVDNTVNYLTHGRNGFETVARLVEQCEIFELQYGEIQDALNAIDDLLASTKVAAQ